jgi:hypothetical protein
MKNRFLSLIASLLVAGPAVAAQSGAPSVEITGAVRQAPKLTAADLAALPRAAVEMNNGGIAVKYEGVWLHEILKKAGVPGGQELRGPALAGYVLVTAQDGYPVVFSVAELEPMFAGNSILLAGTANGNALAGIEAPFSLVAPKEKRGARAVRGVARVDVVMLRR